MWYIHEENDIHLGMDWCCNLSLAQNHQHNVLHYAVQVSVHENDTVSLHHMLRYKWTIDPNPSIHNPLHHED